MSTTPAVLDTARAAEIETKGADIRREVEALAVVDAASHARAAALAQLGAAMEAEIHSFMDGLCDSAFQHHRLLTGRRAELLAIPTGIRQMAAQKAIAFEREQKRLREAAELEVRREQERLEALERQRVEAERRRLRAEAEEKAIYAAGQAEARGDHQAAEQIISQPVPEPVVAARPVFVPPPAVPLPPKAEGLSSRTDWTFEIVDAALIPRQYLIVDEKAIRAVVRALKDKHGIPGVRAVEKDIAITRRT